MMKYLTDKLAIIWICLLAIFACTDEIDFRSSRKGGQLVVDGRITNSYSPRTIKLFRVNEVGRSTDAVTGAMVSISDDIGNEEQLSEIEEGTYVLEGNQLRGQKGRTYTLKILLADGTEYRSLPEMMPDVEMKQDSAYARLVTETVLGEGEALIDVERIQIFVDSRIPAEPVYLKWTINHVFVRISADPFGSTQACFVTVFPNPQDFVLHNGANEQSFDFVEQNVGSKIVNNDFWYLNVFNVVRSSLSPGAFEYWERVNQVVNSMGTIFDVPAATVPGNIFNVDDPDDDVLGYFEAVAQDTSRVFLSRIDFELTKVFDPCGPGFFVENVESCRDCLALPSSTLEKPSYWVN